MTRRKEILGRHLFDVSPDNPGDPTTTAVANTRASLDRVLQHRVPDTMGVQKHDIRRPESKGGGFEERYWSPVNSPVLEAKEVVAYIYPSRRGRHGIHPPEAGGSEQGRITETLRTRAGEIEAEIFLRAQQVREINNQLRTELGARKRTEEALRESEERFGSVTGTARDAVARSLRLRDRTYRRPIYNRMQRFERAEVP